MGGSRQAGLFEGVSRAGRARSSVVDVTVAGEILRINFTSADGHYVVLTIRDRDGRERVLVGALGGLCEGQEIEAKGRHEVHPEHGPQVRVTDFRAVLPSSEEGIRRYLGSGLIPGIGPKLAERIVGHFGAETLSVLDRYSSRLLEISGFGKRRLATIREAWREHAERRDVYVFLQGLGISPAYCDRIYRRFGQATPEVVAANPYQLAAEVKRIGFKMADAIAGRLNIAKDNPFRLASGILYVLGELADRGGHLCYPQGQLVAQAAEILEVEAAAAEQGLERALLDGSVVVDTGATAAGRELVYRRDLYRSERDLSAALGALMHQPVRAIAPDELPRSGDWSQLNAAQQQAVITVFRHPVSIITGGPGVGKTTVTREIVGAARRLKWRIWLAAPTGRAAKRLSESCGFPAQTIHRLLKWEPGSQRFVHDQHYPLERGLVIIDEVSMLDVPLACQLCEAVALGSRLVLVGDHDQLPSVGPGSFLRDLIACGRIPVTHLLEVFRQAANSHIILNAHRVNAGEMPSRGSADQQLSDFYWIEQADPERVVPMVVEMVARRIPRRFRFAPMRDIQVLTPMNRGVCGALNLNQQLQERLNPLGNRAWQQFETARGPLRVGDRVMQISNNYDLQVFNGDLGRLLRVDNAAKRFTVQFDSGPVEYGQEEADQLRLAYAITIHKSQGCEFPAVIVPVLTQHYVMLRRNLIYTAMTRASRLLVLVGATKALAMAVRNINESPRFSRLADCLRHV